MWRVLAVAAALLVLFGCRTVGADIVCLSAPHETTILQIGSPAPPCADAVIAAAKATIPCSDLPRSFVGLVTWKPAPFACDMPDGHLVWGCSDPYACNVRAQVAAGGVSGTILAHSTSTALGEELGHWIWQWCYPKRKIEWYDAAGNEVRDPEFTAWIQTVNATARAACP